MLQLYIEEDMRVPPSERNEVKSENHLSTDQHLNYNGTVTNDTNNIKKMDSDNNSVNTTGQNNTDAPKIAKPRINVTAKQLK